ncbi:MAG TPA: winged helix-turn-helix domain-containing protein [Gammaproteobacteria bacterium]|nr:winged helix-turn-helix domain-containing protein [Gammaproteobacteria bacterium]
MANFAAMDQRLRHGFRLGAFDVEPLAGRISGPDGAEHVQPKVMDVLLFLAAHEGQVVERDTLLQQVWQRVTSEEVLTRCISELRRALGDDRGTPTYIQTVPKRGYRLVGKLIVAAEEGAQSAVTPAAPAPAVAAGPPALAAALASVAVLPFDTHSADPNQAFLGDAFAAELHGTLARVDRLRVASRRASFVFKDPGTGLEEIGKRLNVDYVISGSLRCAGPALRVFAELSDARNNTQLWAQSYDRNNEDLLRVEREVAEAIVSSFTTLKLRAETSGARQQASVSLDAWGLVQKARAFVLDYSAEGLAAAIEPLERAIELDRDYPAAHATLASLLVERLVNGLSEDAAADERGALAAATKALTLAPEDPFILKLVGLAFSYVGEQRKALGCLRKAIGQSPFDFGAWGYLGWPLTATGEPQDLAELRGVLERLLAMEPQHPGAAFWLYHRSVVDACEGDFAAARRSAEAAVEARPRLALAWMHYANVLGHEGEKAQAREALAQCQKINAALTPRHFESLVKKIAASAVVEPRVGGLKKIGALRP